MSPSTAPDGYPMHHLGTRFLRVPIDDWNSVKIFNKREFRTKPRGGGAIYAIECPSPIVAYAVSRNGARACKLMVLAERRLERLVDIANKPESLELEGFDTYDEFKGYWRKRNAGIYKPLQEVIVHRLAPWPSDENQGRLGMRMIKRLYGEFIQPGTEFSEHVI